MKKFLKTIFIIILCIAVAGGTGYLFYSNMTESVSAFEEINEFKLSAGQKELDINISNIAKTGGDRFNLLIDCYNDMQDSLYCLNAYLIDYDNESVENSLIELISGLESEISILNSMIEEYNIKSQNQSFDKKIGANNIYLQFSKYIVKFSNCVMSVKNKVLTNVYTKNVDVKFSIIDIYVNVVNEELSNLTVENANTFENLSYMINHFSLQNGYIKCVNGDVDFSTNCNLFVNAYNQCDKVEFAKNLKSNIVSASSSSLNQNLVAGYYLSKLIGE